MSNVLSTRLRDSRDRRDFHSAFEQKQDANELKAAHLAIAVQHGSRLVRNHLFRNKDVAVQNAELD